MRRYAIHCSVILLLLGFSGLAAGQVNAQTPALSDSATSLHLLSSSWGITQGQTARISLANLATSSQSTRTDVPVIARIQLLDFEGEVIAESDEISVAPGKIQFWDARRDEIAALGEPQTGRIQVRTRVLVTTTSLDLDRAASLLDLTVELIEPGTSKVIWVKLRLKQEFPGG